MTLELNQVLPLAGSSLLLLIGVPGNLLIVWTYFAIKRIQTHQNIFIVSLAITDAIIIGYLLPLNMVCVVLGEDAMPREMCIINAFVAHVCFTSGVQTIMHIALNRCVKICRPVQEYIRIYTRRNVALILTSCWLMGPLFSVPLWQNSEEYFVFDKTLHMCIFNRYGDKSYTLIYQGLCLGIPILVTTVCYVKIQRHVWVAKRQLSRHWNNGLARQRFFLDLRATRSHAIIFIAYLVLYLPFGVIATFISTRDEIPENVHAMTIYLCYANSCINSLIYGALNGNIRRAYKEALTCKTNKKQEASLSVGEQRANCNTSHRVFPERTQTTNTGIEMHVLSVREVNLSSNEFSA